MKHFPLLLLLAATSVLYSFSGNRPRAVSLQSAVTEALEHNPDLLAAFKNNALADADKITAGLKANPSLNVIGDIAPFPGEPFRPRDKFYGLSLSLPIDPFGKREERLALAGKLSELTQQQTADTKRLLVQKVTSAYFTALALRDRLELARTNLERLNSFVALTRLRAEQQAIPAIDVTRSEVTRDQYKNELSSVATAFTAALSDLQTLMGREVSKDSLILESDIEDISAPEALTPDEAYTYAISHRPDYLALRTSVDAEEHNLKLQKLLAYPDISVSADYSNQSNTNFLGMSVSMGLPVFSKNEGEIAKSTVRNDQNYLQLQSFTAALKSDIQKSRDEMLNLWEVVNSLKNTVLPRSEEVLKTIEFSYKSGNTTLLDYLDAQRSFTETRIAYIDALYRYQLSKTAFETIIAKEN